MPRQNHEELCCDWTTIASKIGEAQRLLDQTEVSLTIDALSDIDTGRDSSEHIALTRVINRVRKAATELSGLSYLCRPQTEWMGGDSDDRDNYKLRVPHIVNEV